LLELSAGSQLRLYRCPVASDMPMIEAVLVEVPYPRHPFGARGVGEVPIVPPRRSPPPTAA
jgi:CO/xanthine dehydrogenase Mo-binding subunit